MSDCGTGLFVHWLKTLCSPIKTDLEWPYLGVYQIFRHTQITSEYIARRKINKYHKPCWILGEVYQESYIAVCVNHNKWTTRHFYHFLSHSREYCEVSYEKIGMLIWVKSPQCASFLQVFLATLLSSPEPMAVPHGILQFWSVPHGSPNRQERCSFITDDGYFESARVAAPWLISMLHMLPEEPNWHHIEQHRPMDPLCNSSIRPWFLCFVLWRGCDYLRIPWIPMVPPSKTWGWNGSHTSIWSRKAGFRSAPNPSVYHFPQ